MTLKKAEEIRDILFHKVLELEIKQESDKDNWFVRITNISLYQADAIAKKIIEKDIQCAVSVISDTLKNPYRMVMK